jgi:hypothetical protein
MDFSWRTRRIDADIAKNRENSLLIENQLGFSGRHPKDTAEEGESDLDRPLLLSAILFI